ncbi:hypothetical protein F383_20720 [Gossypium arboreum]|uniref:Uncharacterized protein n=1 Tax=Gossypium arboreum TaxID=29729 RepID=A0A0B0NZH7_GOSAR|nr:hypothetical protein F383_20720 [Gossypium arboreum]
MGNTRIPPGYWSGRAGRGPIRCRKRKQPPFFHSFALLGFIKPIIAPLPNRLGSPRTVVGATPRLNSGEPSGGGGAHEGLSGGCNARVPSLLFFC